MARSSNPRGLSFSDADLATRCVPIAKLLYRLIESRDPLVRHVSISSFCFAEREIYQTIQVSVALGLSQKTSEEMQYTFILFNRTVLAPDNVRTVMATDQWEVQEIRLKSTGSGGASSSSSNMRTWPQHFQSTPDLPLPVFPETPIVGTVDVLHGDFSGGYGLQVNFDPERARQRSEPTTIVRSFSFSNFYQYCVAQSLAVASRELYCAQAQFDEAWKTLSSKLPQPTTAE